jgi:GNAT superfamily N-acetyltransferase
MQNKSNYSIRPALDNDKSFAASLHKKCYQKVVVNQFGKWDDNIQRGFFEKSWKTSNHEIIMQNGISVGVLCIQRHPDHIFLSEIQIEPAFQHHGLGTSIINAICSEAADKKIPIRLQILQKNKAIMLYSRLGFRQTGRTDTHILMERDAAQPK